MNYKKIIEIVEKATGNTLPWKIVNKQNKQLPNNPTIFHIKGEPPDKKYDLIIAESKEDIKLASPFLHPHSKLYLKCQTNDLQEILGIAHKHELFWAECRREVELSHLILRPRRQFDKPKWEKQEGDVLLHCDWGWGDNIQFLRYTQLVKQICQGRVILETRLGLEEIAQSLQGVDQIVLKGESLPNFDYHSEIADLEGILKIVPRPPYLFVNTKRVLSKKKFNIGCVWHGHHLTFNFFRFYDPQLLKSLQIANTQLYSLQKTTENNFPPCPKFIEDLSVQITTWQDTANLLSQMNLLITTDTAIAHLAGGLNMPTWIILPPKKYNTPVTTNTHLWYPNTKLFINSENNWDNLFSKLRSQLIDVLASKILY